MYKIPKTKLKGINLTVKNYATINLEKHRLNILTWKCSDPEGLWASDFLRFCSICTYMMMGCTHETHVSHAIHRLWRNEWMSPAPGLWSFPSHEVGWECSTCAPGEGYMHHGTDGAVGSGLLLWFWGWTRSSDLHSQCCYPMSHLTGSNSGTLGILVLHSTCATFPP